MATEFVKITDPDYPAETVPGLVELSGYFFVMTPEGEIYNSDLEDATSWNALNFITAEFESDAAVALAKHNNYIVALKDQTIELFYVTDNATGSPLAPLNNAALQIGCASGTSIAYLDGGMFFISKSRSKARSAHYFPAGDIQPVEIGDDAISRVLSSADLSNTHCFACKINGQSFYVVTMVTEGITLAYSLSSRAWSQWTLLTAGPAKSVSSISQSGGIATATVTGHGFSDGDPVTIAGATPSGYNGSFNINVIDDNTISFVVSDSLAAATGTITATGWTEGYFPFGFYIQNQNNDYIQHETTGQTFLISSDYVSDNGALINKRVVTGKLDFGNTDRKQMYSVTVVGDQVNANILVRRTDDDYQSFSTYRQVSMSGDKPQIRRMGQFRRRAFDLRITDSVFVRIAAIDAEIEQGG